MGENKSVVSFMGSMSDVLIAEAGLTPDQAVSALGVLLENVQNKFGGQRVYIASSKRGCPQKLSAKNKQLVLHHHQVSGWSISKIAAEMKVSERTVYRVISG